MVTQAYLRSSSKLGIFLELEDFFLFIPRLSLPNYFALELSQQAISGLALPPLEALTFPYDLYYSSAAARLQHSGNSNHSIYKLISSCQSKAKEKH